MLTYLNENCSKAELGLAPDVQKWQITEVLPNKKLPDRQKEPITTFTIKLRGFYLPPGKTAKVDYLRFKAKLKLEIDRTDENNPQFSLAER